MVYAWLTAAIFLFSLLDIPLTLGASSSNAPVPDEVVIWLRNLTTVGWIGRGFTLVVGVVLDARNRLTRDAAHYLGIALPLASHVIYFLARLL